MRQPHLALAPLTLAALLAIGVSAPAHGQLTANSPVAITIAAQPLGAALNELARQAGLQLLFVPALVAGKVAPAVSGTLTPQQALDRLLVGSDLIAVKEGNTLVVKAPSSATDNKTLPVVTVTASSDPETAIGPVKGFVATLSSTATKTDTPLIETPQSISVITRDEMDARGFQNVMDAVRYTPGVLPENWGVDFRGREWLLMRGFDAKDGSSYLDGLQQGRVGFIAMRKDSYGLERVDVLRGPSSVLFGQGDAGGIINRVSKRPSANAENEIEVQAGNYGRKQLAVDVGGALDSEDKLRYRLVGLGLDTDTQLQYATGQRVNMQHSFIAPSLLWKPTADTSLLVMADIYHDNNGGAPVYVARADGSNSGVLDGDPRFLKYNYHQSSIGYEFEHLLNSAWAVQQNFRYSVGSLSNRRLNGGGIESDGYTYTRTPMFADQSLHQTLLDTRAIGKFSTDSATHTVLVGVDWNRRVGQSKDYQGAADERDLRSPTLGDVPAAPTSLVEDYRETSRQTGLYLQDQIKFAERWIFTLGGRYDSVDYSYADAVTQSTLLQRDHAFSSRAGMAYLLPNGVSPYLSYSESFTPQMGTDYSGKHFDPSRGKQYEVGVKYHPAGRKILLTAALFSLDKTNVQTTDPVHQDYYVLTGAIRSRGVELEAKTELARGLDLIAAYSLANVKVTASNDGDVGRMPIQIPRQTASAWLDYAFSGQSHQGWSVGGGVRYVGQRYNDSANTQAEPAYTLLDLALRHEHGPWRFAININNVTNKKYYASRAYGNFYSGAERLVVASLKYRF